MSLKSDGKSVLNYQGKLSVAPMMERSDFPTLARVCG